MAKNYQNVLSNKPFEQQQYIAHLANKIDNQFLKNAFQAMSERTRQKKQVERKRWAFTK